MRVVYFFVLVALSAAACKPKAKDAAATPPAPAPVFPGLPIETLRILVAECDRIDYVMYNPPFSMSNDGRNNALGALQHISEALPAHNPATPATGHVFYQAKGETLLEADLYFGPAGNYFVFYEDGKPAFANTMSESGTTFFTSVFRNLQGAPQ